MSTVWTDVYRYQPAAERQKPGFGLVWQLPFLWLPGRAMREPLATANDDQEYNGLKEGYRRLVFAVCIQAISDSVHGSTDAMDWLRSEGYEWLDTLGFSMSAKTWREWIDNGCPGAMDKRGFIGRYESVYNPGEPASFGSFWQYPFDKTKINKRSKKP